MVLKKFTWPAELTLSLIGGKWKGLILHHLLTQGSQRFGELKTLTNGISAKILAKHLKELEFDGLITRFVTESDKPRILYAPTERSHSLAPILIAIEQWGEDHLLVYSETGVAKGPTSLTSPPGSFGTPILDPVIGLATVTVGSAREPSARNLQKDISRGPGRDFEGSEELYGRPIPDIALIS